MRDSALSAVEEMNAYVFQQDKKTNEEVRRYSQALTLTLAQTLTLIGSEALLSGR